MLDHVSITVSDIAAAERFYDAILKALDVVKVGRRDDWLGYGERARGVSESRLPHDPQRPDDVVRRNELGRRHFALERKDEPRPRVVADRRAARGTGVRDDLADGILGLVPDFEPEGVVAGRQNFASHLPR